MRKERNESMAEQNVNETKRVYFAAFFFHSVLFFAALHFFFSSICISALQREVLSPAAFFYTSPNTYEAGEMWQGYGRKVQNKTSKQKQETMHMT